MKKAIAAVLVLLLLSSCSIRPTKHAEPSSPSPRSDSKTKPDASPGTTGRTPDLRGGNESDTRRASPQHGPIQHDPALSSILFYTGPRNEKKAALTFDDGPDDRFTPQILDILRQNQIHATFFIVGVRAQAHPETVRQILKEGHAIGNHSWDHPDFLKITSDKVRTEVEQTEKLLQQIAGFRPALFRPPYGAANKQDLNELAGLGYKVIDWSVDTRDWAGTPPNTIMGYLEKELTPGAIILQHCAGGRGENLSNTVEALPQMIDYLKKNGYTFATVPELLKLNEAQASL